ncbi:MAG: bifunctional adenosylcobinamide kinase/adenosylcobinamide-phosphate guanylyltransferase [Desulfobacteraceae bacterium]|jgi:adenosylcobinamide kinase/adenosylcobinamide-phosphate guanylyltransferase
MFPNSTLVIGGCRSGKSGHALELANQMGQNGKIFVATCVPQDQEMRQRVDNHIKERGNEWQTIEAPLDVAKVIIMPPTHAKVILIDCLTLWVSNLLMKDEHIENIHNKGEELATAIESSTCPVILVTNEVGLGIVPGNRLSRMFRDATGAVNQIIASTCERVIMTVAGIAVTIK